MRRGARRSGACSPSSRPASPRTPRGCSTSGSIARSSARSSPPTTRCRIPDGVGDAALNEAVARVHTGGVALFGGLARLGWTIAHVAAGDVADEACAGIDTVLGRSLAGEWPATTT